MRRLSLSVALLAVATPALAHEGHAPHIHGEVLGAVLLLAAFGLICVVWVGRKAARRSHMRRVG